MIEWNVYKEDINNKNFIKYNIFAVTELLRRGESIEKLHDATKITELFLEAFNDIVSPAYYFARHSIRRRNISYFYCSVLWR